MKTEKLPSVVIINGKNPLLSGGGYQTYTYILAELLSQLKYDVHVFSFGPSEDIKKNKLGTFYTTNSWIYNLSFFRTTESGALAILAPLLAFSILRKYDFTKPTILFGIGPWTLTGAIIKILKPKAKTVLISYYPTTFKHEYYGTVCAMRSSDYGIVKSTKAWITYHTVIPIYSLLEKFSALSSDRIINHYKSAEIILQNQFKVNASRLVRIPYYVDIVKRITYEKNSNEDLLLHRKPFILLICRHDGRKGINFLLHAFEILNKRNIKYDAVLVGGGKLLAVHKELAKKLELNNIHFLGFVGDPTKFLKKADMFVFPSVEEGSSSISILEAMKYGLPIVSTDVDGIPEDIENEKSGLLVPPFNPLYLANAMERIIRNPRWGQQLGEQAKKRYLEKNNREMVIRQLSNFLKKMIKEYHL